MTDRQLDFALTEPKQYFNILMPGDGGEQTVYTRHGNFYISPVEDGQAMLVNADGYPVANSAGSPITFTDDVTNFATDASGSLTLTHTDGRVETVELGISVMQRPNLMERLSSTNFALPGNLADLGVTQQQVLTDLRGATRNQVGIESGMLEGSNVNYEKEMTDLITVQRSYQFNARTVTFADQMLGLINGIR